MLLKVCTRKITSDRGGLLIFLIPLMTTALPSMKRVLSIAESVLVPLRSTAAASTTDASI